MHTRRQSLPTRTRACPSSGNSKTPARTSKSLYRSRRGGTLKPSAFAVLRLMSNSSFVGSLHRNGQSLSPSCSWCRSVLGATSQVPIPPSNHFSEWRQTRPNRPEVGHCGKARCVPGTSAMVRRPGRRADTLGSTGLGALLFSLHGDGEATRDARGELATPAQAH